MLKKSRRKIRRDFLCGIAENGGGVGAPRPTHGPEGGQGGVPDDPGCVRQGERPRADRKSAPTV